MGQSKFLYPEMAIAPHGILSNYLHKKYNKNLGWAIIWFESRNQNIKAMSFEINKYNSVNKDIDTENELLKYIKNTNVYKAEYIVEPIKKISTQQIEYCGHNTISLLKDNNGIDKFIEDSIYGDFRNSHEYITSTKENINTVDIDYLWMKDGEIRGLEVSTFYTKMKDKETAEKLVADFIKNRIIDRKKHGQFEVLCKCNDIIDKFNINMVFVNNKFNSTEIIEDSNVIWFKLTLEQIERMKKGKLPINMKFDTLENFLKRL